MLARLGHDPGVGRNGQEGKINAACARHHGMDEIPVSRHVNDADRVAVVE